VRWSTFLILWKTFLIACSVWRTAAGSAMRGRPGRSGDLTSAFVERALERIALEEDPAYTQLWMSLTKYRRRP